MTLSDYHKNYSIKSDVDIDKRAEVKRFEINTIFSQVNLDTDSNPVRIAVLGCADKRLIAKHKQIFSGVLKLPIELFTFDITTQHLEGETNVIKHDCTLPLPDGPFDITYAHVLLKFIEVEKQWDCILNSIQALKEGGVAIHIMDKEDYTTESNKLMGGYYTVPLKRWEKKIIYEKIKFKKIPLVYGKIEGLALVLFK